MITYRFCEFDTSWSEVLIVDTIPAQNIVGVIRIIAISNEEVSITWEPIDASYLLDPPRKNDEL